MKPIGIEDATTLTTIVVSSITIFATLARFIAKTLKSNKMDDLNLENTELAFRRLNSEIDKLSERCHKLEHVIEDIRNIEFEGAEDLATLNENVKQMPCRACDAPKNKFQHIQDIVIRMINRRKKKYEIITGGNSHA